MENLEKKIKELTKEYISLLERATKIKNDEECAAEIKNANASRISTFLQERLHPSNGWDVNNQINFTGEKVELYGIYGYYWNGDANWRKQIDNKICFAKEILNKNLTPENGWLVF